MDPAPISVRNSIRALYDVKNCVHRSYIPDKSSYILQRLYQPRFFTRRCVAHVRASVCDVSKTCEIWTWSSPRPVQDGSSCRLSSLFRVRRRTRYGRISPASWRCERIGGARRAEVQTHQPTAKLRGANAEALHKTRRIISLRGRARINFASKHAARSQVIAVSDDAHRRRRQFYSLLLIHPV